MLKLIMVLFFLLTPIIAQSAIIEVPKDFSNIQEAINSSSNGDTIIVAPGTYVENINFKGKAITIKSSGGAMNTVIDANQAGSCVVFYLNEGPDSVLEGFTLTNGTGSHMGVKTHGGGVFCLHLCSPTIRKNIICNNTCYSGGGIYYQFANSPIIEDNLIYGNCTDGEGGGLFGFNCSEMYISNNTIHDNYASSGAGICLYGSSAQLYNNNMIHNIAGYDGGAIFCSGYCDLVIINNTLWHNIADIYGGGVCVANHSDISIYNTLFWSNFAPIGKEICVGGNHTASKCKIDYCDVMGMLGSVYCDGAASLDWGTSIIDADPLFVNLTSQDFHLQYNSPCRDTGINNPPHDVPKFDFEGDPRIASGTIDMGADEFHTHLYYTGNPAPGEKVTLNFTDTPNTTPVFLWIGSGVLDPPFHSSKYGAFHLQTPLLATIYLGTISPPSGVLTLSFTIDKSSPKMQIPFQALLGNKLTNLCVMNIK